VGERGKYGDLRDVAQADDCVTDDSFRCGHGVLSDETGQSSRLEVLYR
jgi:hypothetical protein